MWILHFAWKNLWRNKTRTLITVSAIFFAVILSTLAASLKQGVFDNLVKNVVSFYTGYIQVHKLGYQDEQILDNGFQKSALLENKFISYNNVSFFAPRLESFALASSQNITKGSLVVGISPRSENRITLLKNKLVSGNFLNENDECVLVAEGLAKTLQLKTGDTIVLIGQGYHGSTAAGKYRIKGVLHFGSPQLNERILYMSLPAAQELFSAKGLLTSYILSIKNEKELVNTANNLRNSIGKEYELLTWEQLLPEIKQHITTDSNNMKVVQGILYLLICFGIFSTMLMMLMERRFEMGMLVAIGMKKTRLSWLFVIESVLTVMMGCFAGLLASIPLVYYLNRHPLRLGGETAKAYERFGFEAIFPASTNSSIFLSQVLVVVVIGLLLSFYPVFKIAGLRPVTAMKK
jgi:ABC-type lipoprotein release transport system permease subunit